VGQKKIAVAEKVRSISREAHRIKNDIKEKEDAQKKKEEAIEKKTQQDLKTALAKAKDWDVTGTWEISCPHIEDQWPDDDDKSLQIYHERTPKGCQMFAKFNFGVVTGVFRFERQQGDTKTKAPQPSRKNDKRKRKRDEYEEDGDSDQEESYNEEDAEGRRSPTPEAFYFGSITQPSAKYQSWNYRWRGEETGEGEISLYSEKRLFKMRFHGPKVEKLEGTFGGDFLEDCTFVGVKVGVKCEDDINIAEEWAERNEDAHESARVGRWF
jgi:hypothetical protein